MSPEQQKMYFTSAKMTCTEFLLNSIEIENSTSLIVYEQNYNAKEQELLDQLQNSTNNVLLFTFNAIETLNVVILIQIIILITSNVSDVKTFFHQWHKSSNFQSNLKYIIYYFGPNSTVTHFDKFANAAWEFYVYNVAIIDELENIYVQNELTFDNCNLTTTRKLTSCDEIKSDNKNYELSRFKHILERKYENFQRCPISTMALVVPPFVVNVSSPNYRGLEPLYLEIIADKMNFSVKYVDHNYTSFGLYINGQFKCCILAGLNQSESDMVIGMVWYTAEISENFDYSNPIVHTDSRFYIPLAKRQVPWMDIAKIYTPSAWAIIFGSLLFMTIFYCCIERHRNVINNVPRTKYSIIHELFQSFMDIFATILTEAIRLPRNMLNRMVIMSWILVAFIFSSTYEGVLLTFLMTPVYEKQIITIKDVAESNLPIYGHVIGRVTFSMADDPYLKRITNRWTDASLTQTIKAIEQVALKGNIIASANYARVHYGMKIERKYLNRHNQSALYIGPPLLIYYTGIIMQRGLPIKIKANKYILMLQEGGWIEYYQRNITMAIEKVPKDRSFVPIQIASLLLAFFIYVGGMGLASIACLIENVLSRKVKNQISQI